MGEAAWWLILGSLLVKSEFALAWGSSCPTECSCHLSYFSDLPLHHWQDTVTGSKTKEHNNEAFYEDEDTNNRSGKLGGPTELLKMAMCIFLTEISASTLLDQLPVDTQVLLLLQGRNTGEILLEAESIQGFHDLIYLDVQGYGHDTSQDTPDLSQEINNSLILSDDFFKSLMSLQYLNLQNIKLQSPSEKDNKIHSINNPITFIDPVSNEISISLQETNVRKRSRVHPEQAKEQNLIFLTPSGSESEVVPYKTYLERKEQSGSSIFAGLSSLEFLRVYSCDLHDISWEMFDGLHKLKFLSLEKNHLLFIPEFAFYGTPNLKTLSLSKNKLLNLQSTSLAGLLKLEELDLSYNKFSHLSEFSLPPFPKLRTANFKYNPIEAIFAGTFEIMNATKTLHLGGNSSILEIHPNSFLGLQSLQKLTIDNISTELLERQLMNGMPELKELEIFGSITALSFDAFVEVPKLENLYLRNCEIETISMDAFYGLYNLLILDLSTNKLQTLPPGLFDQQFSLKELYLQNNLLTELPVSFFKNLPVQLVRLEGNPWHCSCSMKDWPSSVINKVKQKKESLCHTEYDKGSACSTTHEEGFLYDKKVTPHCTTPKKFKGLGVFQVLRKELRCTKKLRNKLNRTFYLKKKYEEYEKLIKTGYYDHERKEYLEQLQKISKSRNNSLLSYKHKSMINEVGSGTNKQLKEPQVLQEKLIPTYQLEKTSSLPEQLNSSIDHTREPMTTAKLESNITDKKSDETSNSTIKLKLESLLINELSPVAQGNDLQGYKDVGITHITKTRELNSIKLGVETQTKYQSKLQSQNQIVLNRSERDDSHKETFNFKVTAGKEEAKALKKTLKQDMDKNHLRKLQKYYSQETLLT